MTARYRVLVTAPYFLPVLPRFQERFAGHGIEATAHPVLERVSEGELLEIIPPYHGVICGDDAFTHRVLRAATHLRVICKWGTGIDSIAQESCQEMGIRVCNTEDAFSHPVADTTLGYTLAFCRRQPWMDRQMKAGQWQKLAGCSLRECTFGIVGVGNIGRRVAERLKPFGPRILGTDIRTIPPTVIRTTGLQPVDLDELLQASDFVSLHCDLNPTSHHLIDGKALHRMKPTAVLINTARGPVVDEPALVQALQSGDIGGVALDVFEVEPLPAQSPLRAMDNVMLAPHNANSSARAWEAVHESTVRQLIEELERDG